MSTKIVRHAALIKQAALHVMRDLHYQILLVEKSKFVCQIVTILTVKNAKIRRKHVRLVRQIMNLLQYQNPVLKYACNKCVQILTVRLVQKIDLNARHARKDILTYNFLHKQLKFA